MSHCIVVLGMHRSGTSALTGVFQSLGVELGHDLLSPEADNPRGFFENREVKRLHDELLARLGSSWDDFRPLPASWLDAPEAQESLVKLNAIVTRNFSGAPVWGVKDPRLCRLLPLWDGVLQKVPARTGCVLLYRPASEVVASLVSRNGMSPNKALLLWIDHSIRAAQVSSRYPRVLVRYADLLADWRGVAKRVATALDVAWPVRADSAAEKIDGFLSKDLRRARAGGLPKECDPALVRLARRCDEWLSNVDTALGEMTHFGELDGEWRAAVTRNLGWHDEAAARLRESLRETKGRSALQRLAVGIKRLIDS